MSALRSDFETPLAGPPNPRRESAPGHRRQVCAYNLSSGTCSFRTATMCGLRHFSQWKGLKDHLLSALRGAPPCTPANRCSETQSQRIRPCLFVERTKLRNFCPILRTVWILDLRSHEDKVSHTPSSQNAHGHATAEACKRAGVPLIKGQPCPCCRKTVHDKTDTLHNVRCCSKSFSTTLCTA